MLIKFPPLDPKMQLVEVLEAPLIEDRVTFIKGTIMDEEALNRAGALNAVAAFIFSDGCVRTSVVLLCQITLPPSLPDH